MKAWSRLMQACGAASAAILGLVTVAVVWDVVARNLGARSLPWIVEATEYALPLATFLAAPWLMFRYEHVRLDLLATKLSKPNLMRVERVTAAVRGRVVRDEGDTTLRPSRCHRNFKKTPICGARHLHK